MNKKEQAYKEARKAIDKLFSDTSVSRQTTKENLYDLKEIIENYLDTL